MGKNTTTTVLTACANISQADIKLKSSHDIEIVLVRSPHTNTVENLSARIAAIEALGLTWDEVDARIIEQVDNLFGEAGYLRKQFITEEDYAALTEINENVLYIID